MDTDDISRRNLLVAATAGASALIVGGMSLFMEPRQTLTKSATIEPRLTPDTTLAKSTGEDEPALTLEWQEVYNGAEIIDSTGGTAEFDTEGPSFSFGNILPGDSGHVVMNVQNGFEESVQLEVSLEVTRRPSEPGLEEFLHAKLWQDEGILGIDSLGGQNGVRDIGEPLLAEGTFGDVAAVLEEGAILGECIDDHVAFTFEWAFPPGQENINAAQGASLEFDLELAARPC